LFDPAARRLQAAAAAMNDWMTPVWRHRVNTLASHLVVVVSMSSITLTRSLRDDRMLWRATHGGRPWVDKVLAVNRACPSAQIARSLAPRRRWPVAVVSCRCHIKMSPLWKIHPGRNNHRFDMSPSY